MAGAVHVSGGGSASATPSTRAQAAEFFLDELLANGTTTAQVLRHGSQERRSMSSSPQPAHGDLRMIAGKVLMDRNCPGRSCCDTAADGERDTRELIETWHGKRSLALRDHAALRADLDDRATGERGRIAREYPDVFIHSHLAENRDEIAWAQRLFPDSAQLSRCL